MAVTELTLPENAGMVVNICMQRGTNNNLLFILSSNKSRTVFVSIALSLAGKCVCLRLPEFSLLSL